MKKKKNRKKVRIEAARVVLKDDYKGVWNVKKEVNFTPLIFVCFRVDLLVSSFYFSLFVILFYSFYSIQLSRFQPYISNKLFHLFQI